ncbi:hypothetical protein YQE_06640, partial [Dendroctonus ponderosae]
MTESCVLLLLVGILALSDGIFGDSDLQSALDALDRRQREIVEYEKQQQYGFTPYEQVDELTFLKNAADGNAYGKDYVDDDDYETYNKRLTSSFRERQGYREKQIEEFVRNLYNNLESNGMPGGFNKNDLRALWDRYYGNGLSDENPAMSKRYYPIYEMPNVDLRKGGRYVDNSEEPLLSIHHHVPRLSEPDHKTSYLRNRYPHESSYNPALNMYGVNKRLIVEKRSNTHIKNEKRSVKKQTDPQVEKDLRSIFGSDEKTHADTDKLRKQVSTPKPQAANNVGTPAPRKIEKKDRAKMDVSKDVDINKEVFAPVAPQIGKPLQLKKKSIDWSDYFGLDRRKKSEPNNGLMERYHKAIAITAKKRNANLPLQSFRSHEENSLSKDDSQDKEAQNIDEMGRKLEKLEDDIIGKALKYTGAHQGDSDPKQIQQIKDNIISRLAQAYNIEKMRNALEEYKIEIEKALREVEKSTPDEKLISEYTSEDKRVSVPRKEAISDSKDTVDADNNIKCTTSEDCHEQNYKMPSDIIDSHFAILECPVIQRACNDVASLIGYYGHVFESACHIHQMCLLCSQNSWFSPTRQCNTLFLTKAFELCDGKEECKKEARRSVRYLLDINKSLQAQTALTDECELQCPDTDM